MSNDLHLDGDFTLNIPHFEGEFTENEQPDIQADFIIETGRVQADFKDITGEPYDNSALAEALNLKADISTVESLSETVDNNYSILDNKINIEATARENNDLLLQNGINTLNDDLTAEISNRGTADGILQDNIDTLSGTVSDNYTTLDGKISDNKTAIDNHIADKTNPHEVTKEQIGLGNVDNTSDLNKPISTATQTALDDKQNTINDLSEIRLNASNGQSAYNTIKTFGDIVTYDASSFATNLQGQKADTALQPNDDISKLNNDAGYITSADVPTVNNSTITFQKNNITVGDINLNQANNETINFDIPTTASDVGALPDSTTINNLTTAEQQSALNSGANSTNIGQIATNTQNISNEVTNRQNADNNLQSQIDALVVASDVFDIVGTYAELQAYDISTVPVNDIIKVLVDSTHNNAATYYRCVENDNVKSWSYIGAEGAYYTKSEADGRFVEQITTVNGQALSNNITLDAEDVGALPDSTTIGNGTLTIQKNGSTIDTFGANDTGNTTVNITVPTDTSDLTNNAGFITGINSTDVINALSYTPADESDLSTVATSGSYNDLNDKPTIPAAQVQANWNETDTSSKAYIQNKPTIPTVGNGTITINQGGVQKGTFTTNQSGNTTIDLDSGGSDIEVDDELSTTSENPVQNKIITNALENKANKSDLSTVATSGSYNDLTDKPTIPSAVTESTVSGWGFTKNEGTVTSVNNVEPVNGNVTLSIPQQVQSDWNETDTTSKAYIQNKPTIPTYNFHGVDFYSANAESTNIIRDCNNLVINGHYYYTANGPSGLGEQSTDGAVFVQAYNDNWVVQIAQDYRTGNIFTRSRNNGTWTAWKTVGDINSSSLTQVQVVTETYSSGSSWYRVWSDGWCEQGGTIVGSSTNNTTISLLKAYRDTSYSVVFGNLYKAATTTATSIVASTTKTSSSFQVYDSTDANFSTYWISYGYLY